MDKRAFVQHAVITFAPWMADPETGQWDIERAIRTAEKLYDLLAERGYGPAKPRGPRQTPDYITEMAQRLGEAASKSFETAYRAYARPGDSKQGAAGAWLRLAPDAALQRHIIWAAGQDAAIPRAPDANRKMFQGWLNDRRWEGFHMPGAADSPRRNLRAEISQAANEIKSLEGMLSQPNQTEAAKASLQRSIDQAHQRLQQLREESKS